MKELVLFLISTIPVILIGTYIYKKDREKEPLKLLLKLFLGGIGSTILVLIISFIISLIFPSFSQDKNNYTLFELIIYAFIKVALIEEICKWLFVYKISYNDNNFNDMYDMIVYSAFVALGFAFFENLLYVYNNGITTGIFRAVSAVPAHVFDGIFMGYYLGLSKISLLNKRKDLFIKNISLSILVPVILHGIYDYCLFTRKTVFIIIFFIFLILIYILSIKKVKHIAKIEFKFKYKNKFCPSCGKEIFGHFCTVCGRKNE